MNCVYAIIPSNKEWTWSILVAQSPRGKRDFCRRTRARDKQWNKTFFFLSSFLLSVEISPLQAENEPGVAE